MREHLHRLLLALTLLDLAFVQATEVVSAAALLPLWLLALASGRLRRLQQHLGYRVTWNVGVLMVFALLVHHATTTGLLHMLEDGLLLAVLCQVHLLNNVGERQRPDLVFFNSFLISFITSFFAPDLTWSVLFALHAVALIVALEVRTMALCGAAVGSETLRTVLRDSVSRCAAIGVVTAVVFVAWPRNFARQGWLGDAMVLRAPLEAGLSDRIDLDREHGARLDETVVLRIQPRSGAAGDVPSHWRARAFTGFDGRAWSPQHAMQLGSRFATDAPWEPGSPGHWRRSENLREAELSVRLFDLGTGRLPVPIGAGGLRVADETGLLWDPKSDGMLAFVRSGEATARFVDYRVELAAQPLAAARSSVRRTMVALPDEGVPRVVRDLARQLRAAAAPDAAVTDIAATSAEWLRENRRYQLPGGPGFARNFEDFLLGGGAGHCEYFATALALVLRLQDVPCRLVGGYLAHEWDPAAAAMVVRARDAHAWVEVLLPDGSWRTFDATPPTGLGDVRAQSQSWWDETRSDLEGLWSAVVGFDATARAQWLSGLVALLRRLASNPWLTGPLALFVAALVLRRRLVRAEPRPVRELRRAARRLGLVRHAGETPREFAARAAAAAPQALAARLEALRGAVAAHEAARYRVVRPPRTSPRTSTTFSSSTVSSSQESP